MTQREQWNQIICMIHSVADDSDNPVLFGLLVSAYAGCICRDDPMEFLAKHNRGFGKSAK